MVFYVFWIFKMFNGNNHGREIPTLIVVHDSVDKMVEKEE